MLHSYMLHKRRSSLLFESHLYPDLISHWTMERPGVDSVEGSKQANKRNFYP